MKWLCTLDLHSWIKRPATHNPHRIVRRCRRCNHISVVKVKAKTSSLK